MFSPITLYMKPYSSLLDKIFAKTVKEFPLLAADISKHIYAAGGKRMRPAFLLLVSSALGAPLPRALNLAAGLELLHCATLLHDDIEDKSALRRGKKAAHIIYGLNGAILTGDAMLAAAYSLIAKYGNSHITNLFSRAVINTLQGQMLELSGARDINEYLTSITQKTGALFAASCQIGAMLAKAPQHIIDEAGAMGCSFGTAYQLFDDALDFLPSSQTGKTTGADLAAGNFTLPLRFYANTLNEVERENFITSLRKKLLTANERSSIIKKVLELGLTKKTNAFAQQYLNAAKKSLLSFPDCEEKNVLWNIFTSNAVQAN